MRNDLNYQDLPYEFIHCINAECTKADRCLRQMAASIVPEDKTYFPIVNPKSVSADGVDCPHYKASDKIKIAWGVSALYDKVPHKTADHLRKQLLAYFGKNVYYRCFRKERAITPEEQAAISRIFILNGIDEAPAFDYFTEEFNW